MWLDRKERGGLQEQMAIGWISTAELFLVSMMLMLAFALFLNTRLRDGDKQKEAESRRAAEAEKLAGEAMAKGGKPRIRQPTPRTGPPKRKTEPPGPRRRPKSVSAVVEKHERRQLEEQERILRPLETAEARGPDLQRGPAEQSRPRPIRPGPQRQALPLAQPPHRLRRCGDGHAHLQRGHARLARGGDLLLEGVISSDKPYLVFCMIRKISASVESAPRGAQVRWEVEVRRGANSGRPCRTRLSWTPSVRSRS